MPVTLQDCSSSHTPQISWTKFKEWPSCKELDKGSSEEMHRELKGKEERRQELLKHFPSVGVGVVADHPANQMSTRISSRVASSRKT